MKTLANYSTITIQMTVIITDYALLHTHTNYFLKSPNPRKQYRNKVNTS